MFSRGKPADRGRKVTPPSPTYMTNEQFASYLTELRRNRLSRPGRAREHPAGPRGARQPEPNASTDLLTYSPVTRQDGEGQQQTQLSRTSIEPRCATPAQASSSVRSRYLTGPKAKDCCPEKPATTLKHSEVVPSSKYIERGQRWMEKEEAYSLRHALDDMDSKERAGSKMATPDDPHLYHAALQEASELVWQHQTGRMPRPGGPYRYRPHLQKNSYAHARAASVGKYGNEIRASGLVRDRSRSASGSSTDSKDSSKPRVSAVAGSNGSPPECTQPGGTAAMSTPSSGISCGRFAASGPRRRSSMKRNISGEMEKPFSGNQIWEEPEGSPKPVQSPIESDRGICVLACKAENPVDRIQLPSKASEANKPAFAQRPSSRVDIHCNPPTQSRNPGYITNPQTTSPAPGAGMMRRKNGIEVRADDIREATSMRLKDRSERLPTPSAVSDDPGRPIVSFDAGWSPPEEKSDRGEDRSRGPTRTPMMPSIVVGEDDSLSSPARGVPIPSITVDDGSNGVGGQKNAVPNMTARRASGSLTQSGSPHVPATPQDVARSSARPLPQPGGDTKVVDHHARQPRAQVPPSKSAAGRAAHCHECGFAIQGRFVALSGSTERFHPRCFSCYACGASLEALEISPEPDTFRRERLDRIKRRAAGEVLEETAGKTMAEDGDERLRFYCHLDWHELFAPRCKHCKTPILGEHIVALGEHWHYGHFFCAECGDPFEQGMTHIEKDGYAWCVGCQTKRTERRAPKCKKCRVAVVGQYIQALGSDWHEQCFKCANCNGAFDDGQVFPKDDGNGLMVVLCTKCRARELKQ